MLAAQQLVGRVPLRLECALQRHPHRTGRRRLVAQPLQQFDDEGGSETAVGLTFCVEETLDALGGVVCIGQRFPAARMLATQSRGQDAVGQPPQLFDQGQAQHDRYRPDFPDRERRDGLIGGDEIDERFQIETSGRVRDQFTGDEINAWIAGKRAIRQLRKLDVILARQVLTDLTNLILDDVVVVAQPVLGSDRLRVGAGDRRQESIRLLEPIGALVEPRQQRLAA